MNNEVEKSVEYDEAYGSAPFFYTWYQTARCKNEKDRLLFFDTFCKIAWVKGYKPKEPKAGDDSREWDYYCQMYYNIRESKGKAKTEAAKEAAKQKAKESKKEDKEGKSSDSKGK